jgi:NCAIR mutase (PurE)-related protein
MAQEAWAVITDTLPSVQTFALYGQRFGGIEPHLVMFQTCWIGIKRHNQTQSD